MIWAVAIRILRQVLLVIVLGIIKCRCRLDFGGDGAESGASELTLEVGARFLGNLLLLGAMRIDC